MFACVRLHCLVVAIGLFAGVAPLGAQPLAPERPARLSPFEAVRWDEGGPVALVGGQWGEVVSIDGVAVADILEFCRATWGERMVRKRFEEDLDEAMGRMPGGVTPGQTVRLVVRRDGAEMALVAANTEENRQRLRRGGLQRDLAGAGEVLVSKADAAAVLDQLVEVLSTRHSYTMAGRADVRAAAARAKTSLDERVTVAGLELALNGVVRLTGDGHAGVRAEGVPEAGAYLPFLPVPVGAEGGPVAAVLPDRSGLVDPEYPYLAAIGGLTLEQWLGQAERFVAAASPQLVRERSCRRLRSYTTLAGLLGLQGPRSAGEMLRVTLADEAGREREVQVPLAPRKPTYGVWPRGRTRIIEAGGRRIGYLRLEEMDGGPDFEALILDALAGLSGASGIIIDVRGNGGGRRDAIHILGSRMLPPGAEPVVYNAARPARQPGEAGVGTDERMASRFLFREDDPRWTDAERAAIGRFRGRFTPEVAVDDGRFGAWYFACVSPHRGGDPTLAGRPVVVLMDAVCFSATDVFLGAMKEMPGATLVGEASAGGSGLTLEHEIAGPSGRPRFEVRLSSMVSFRPDGLLFDGRGVAPDVTVRPLPTDFILGGTDSVLDGALEMLRK